MLSFPDASEVGTEAATSCGVGGSSACQPGKPGSGAGLSPAGARAQLHAPMDLADTASHTFSCTQHTPAALLAQAPAHTRECPSEKVTVTSGYNFT